ncbi:magnesium transporter [Stanieria sp. NIES-3757]|nr:magnesium transporter [Stanieria sp. NIES-3757]
MAENQPFSLRQSSISRQELVDLVRSQLEALLQQGNFPGAKALLVPDRLVGIVTVDDVLDIVEQEATEDIYKLGGVEAGDNNYF